MFCSPSGLALDFQMRGLKNVKNLQVDESQCTAPHAVAYAGSGKKLVSYKIVGDAQKYGPIPGPYMGDFKGHSEEIFFTHRSGSDFDFVFDHKHYINGHPYYVTIGFAENNEHLCKIGGRVFNVKVNAKIIAKNLDVFKESGGCKYALVLTTEMKPVNGIFEISFEGIDAHHAMVSFVDIKAVDANECPK